MNKKDLPLGQVLLTRARLVASGAKIQLEFFENILRPSSGNNLLGLLNASDDRFNQSLLPGYAWMTGQPEEIEQYFGIKAADLTDEWSDVNLLNPKVGEIAIKVEIHETTDPAVGFAGKFSKSDIQYAIDNDDVVLFEEEGVINYPRTSEGKYVFRQSKAIAAVKDPEHTWEKFDQTQNTDELDIQVLTDLEEVEAKSAEEVAAEEATGVVTEK